MLIGYKIIVHYIKHHCMYLLIIMLLSNVSCSDDTEHNIQDEFNINFYDFTDEKVLAYIRAIDTILINAFADITEHNREENRNFVFIALFPFEHGTDARKQIEASEVITCLSFNILMSEEAAIRLFFARTGNIDFVYDKNKWVRRDNMKKYHDKISLDVPGYSESMDFFIEFTYRER